MDNHRMQTYLQQQAQHTQRPSQPPKPVHVTKQQPPPPSETRLVPVEEVSLEDFKNFVKKWLELDAYIKKAQELVKEKRKQRNKLAEIITKFMCKYNIEDLNMKEGRIRCKTSYIREPVTQKEIKEKITTLVPDKKDDIKKIFDERPKKEKVSLRKLKIT